AREEQGPFAMSEFQEIVVERVDQAGIIRFNRPKSLNALTDQMLQDTQAQLLEWELDDSVAAIALTGNERAFCAGGDLKNTGASTMEPYQKYRYRYNQSTWHTFVRFLDNYTKPVIAAIEGYALGGGLELALVCDFAVGSETAKLGEPEAKHSVFPILGGVWTLRQAVGERMAKELLFTARRVGAAEAKDLGLLNHVVPEGKALNKTLEIIAEIAKNGPLAVMAVKQAVHRARSQTFAEALAAGGDLSALMMFSEDRKEGLAAFAEKREPKFKGR
ncbi:MAG: enoyl-CoA hydratase/isomerase family protein, partial [Pseudomonadota bacterium]